MFDGVNLRVLPAAHGSLVLAESGSNHGSCPTVEHWPAVRVTDSALTILLFAVSLGLLLVLLATRRAHHGATESDSVDRLRSHDRRSLQILQNVWLRELSTVLSRAVSEADVAKIMSEEGTIASGCATAEITLRERGSDWVAVVESTLTPPRSAVHLEDRTPITDAIRTGMNVLVLSTSELAARYPGFTPELASKGIDASASIPLVDSGGCVIGAMGFGWSSADVFDEGQLVVFETATELCARALDRVRLYELEYEARRLAENLQAFTMVLAGTESRADVAEAMVNESLRVLGADAASVSMLADDGFAMLVSRGFDDTMDQSQSWPLSETSPAADALRTQSIIVLESQDDLTAAYPSLSAQARLDGDQAWVALPLVLGGEATAVLFATFRTIHSFSSQDRSLMSTMGLQAALAFERARLRENDLAEADKARQLAAAIGGLTAAATKVGVLAAFIDALPALGAQSGTLALLSDDGSSVDVQGGSEASPYLDSEWQTCSIGARTPLITAVRTGESLFIHGRNELTAGFDPSAVEMFSDGQRSWVAVPLYAGGRALGALGLSFIATQRFDDAQRVRLASFAALCANALTRAARFELEHSIAITLQSTLLPKQLKIIAGVELSAQYNPGTRELSVGGDWYDVIELSHNRFLLVVGDVVGHGIESAAAMGKLATATRALAQVVSGPAALLRQLDRVAATDPSTQFASMAIVLVDREAGELRYSLAGHPAPLLKHADGLIESLDMARSIPLGGLVVERPEQALSFTDGVMLLLYTDGLTERRSEHIDARLAVLQTALGETNVGVAGLPRALIASMMAGGEQVDDIAVLCAKFARAVPAFFRIVPAHTRHLSNLRHELRTWLVATGVAPSDCYDCLVAVSEAATNAIEHGHDSDSRPIDIRADDQDGRHRFSITDHGAWKLPVDSGGSRGRGLNLIHLLMDDVTVSPSDNGTNVSFTKRFERTSTP